MLRLLIDTSTWLDLAKRRDGQKWIVPIRVLHFQQRLQLLVPEEPRTLAEIEDAEQEFFDGVWHERHLVFRYRDDRGEDDRTTDGTYRVALEAAERVKACRPGLRPVKSDFEWGMWNLTWLTSGS